MSSNLSKDDDGFIETARLIAGENPPRWLTKQLRRWSPSVMLDGNVHAKQPGRAEVRCRLEAMSRACELVDREIHDPTIFELLVAEEFGPMPDCAGVDAVLDEIERRAYVASYHPALLATGLDDRLAKLGDDARLLAREYRNPVLSEFLRAQQEIGPPAPTIELSASLTEIKRKADAARSSPDLANKAGDTIGGAGRALLPNASRPRALCAAVMLEAWAHFHGGEYPRGSNHTPLWTAAEEYWRACGGVTKGGWNLGQLSAWRPYFEEASEPWLAEIRMELRRHMKFSSE